MDFTVDDAIDAMLAGLAREEPHKLLRLPGVDEEPDCRGVLKLGRGERSDMAEQTTGIRHRDTVYRVATSISVA
jgi:hypothetical protein